MANESRLVLPKPMIAKLESLGIYCQTWVTAERQDRAKRWVLRGVESGGLAHGGAAGATRLPPRCARTSRTSLPAAR